LLPAQGLLHFDPSPVSDLWVERVSLIFPIVPSDG
jgi:hypothetical protein